jgi:hypothetical protein
VSPTVSNVNISTSYITPSITLLGSITLPNVGVYFVGGNIAQLGITSTVSCPMYIQMYYQVNGINTTIPPSISTQVFQTVYTSGGSYQISANSTPFYYNCTSTNTILKLYFLQQQTSTSASSNSGSFSYTNVYLTATRIALKCIRMGTL